MQRKTKIGKAGVIGKALTDNADGSRINGITESPVCCASDGMLQPTGLTQLANGFAAGVVEIDGVAMSAGSSTDVRVSPSFDFSGELAVARLEEWPVKVIGHP